MELTYSYRWTRSRVSRLTFMESTTPSRRQLETRRRLLTGALREFIDKGYAGATLSGVAARAQVSTATLHKHFSTKRALFGGVMARFWNEDGDITLPEMTSGHPRQSLLEVGRAYARLVRGADTAPLFRVIIAETIRHPELGQELYDRGKRPYLERLEDYVRAENERGNLRAPDPELAVRQFLGMINDVVFWPGLLISDLDISESRVEHVVTEAVQTFLARYGRPGS